MPVYGTNSQTLDVARYVKSNMELREALKEQYHAGIAMLADCVRKCPDDMWTTGEYPRYFWRIAFHAAFFTHLGLVQDEKSFEPWPGRPEGVHEEMWQDPASVEPYELPASAGAFTREETLAYLAHIDGIVDSIIDSLDLDTDESGYRWYQNMSKLSHELMTLRHLQGHVGQLSELLIARGIETAWIGKGRLQDWLT